MSLELVIKYDYELTQRELHGIFLIYNECFYHNQIQPTDKFNIHQIKKWLGQSKIFKWYLLKKSTNIVAMASYVYSYESVAQFDINSKLGENICNIAVKGKYQGKGYASQVLKALMNDQDKQKLVLEIKKNSPIYLRLDKWYRKIGFETLLDEQTSLYLVNNKPVNDS